MGGLSSTASPKSSLEAPPATIMIKKKEELVIVDTLLEEGLNDGDLPHLCLDKTLLHNSGHSTLGPKDLEDVLNSVRRANRKLNKLSIMFNKTQAKGVGRFLASDKNVREESMQSIADALKTNSTVVKILLGGRELRREAAEALGGVLEATPCLQQLTLFNCGIGDVGSKYLAAGLASNKTLHFLDLAYCGITDEGAIAIAHGVQQHPSLTSLNVRNNTIRAQGSSALAEVLKSSYVILREFMLGGNKLRDAGAEALADAVAVNTALTYLDLGANEINDEGGLALAEALAQNVCLRHLNLRRNAIGPEICERVRAGWNKRNAKDSTLWGQPWHDGLSLPQ